MVQDGYYRYFKIDPQTELRSRQGLFRIENGELRILEDPKNILQHLFVQGPITKKTMDVMNSGLHSPYFAISKDNDPALDEQHRTPVHGEAQENSQKSEVAGAIKLEALRNMLEKEDDDVEVDIPDHLVIQNSNWRQG